MHVCVHVCVCMCVHVYVKAEEKLREAVKLSPQTNSFVQLGRTHLLRGDLGKAVDVYKTAIE